MNRQASKEWLTIAFHDLQSAHILYEANHYTDSIGTDLQQALEKSFKSLIAYKNEKIPKTHNLLELYEYIKSDIFIDEAELIFLARATQYFKEDRYPNPYYSLPLREEIAEVLAFSENFFESVCAVLGIERKELLE